MKVKKFEDLEIWKRSTVLCVEVYKLGESIKNHAFAAHIGRTGLSISSNIAEGFEREGDKEFIRFLIISRGSCGELRSQLYIGIKTNYIKIEVGEKLIDETRQISAMISGLIKFRRNK